MEEMHMQIDEPLDDPTPSAVTDNQLNLSITRLGALPPQGTFQCSLIHLAIILASAWFGTAQIK